MVGTTEYDLRLPAPYPIHILLPLHPGSTLICRRGTNKRGPGFYNPQGLMALTREVCMSLSKGVSVWVVVHIWVRGEIPVCSVSM